MDAIRHVSGMTALCPTSGRQPNFAALNRGRHLYSAGRPSRWAFAHILVCVLMCYILCVIINIAKVGRYVGRFLETQRMDAIRQVSGMTALFPRCLFNEKQFVIPELRQLSRRTLICTSNMV